MVDQFIYVYLDDILIFLLLSRNMFSTSDECSKGCSRMGFLSRRRNAHFMHSRFRFWVTSSRPREHAWIPIRLRLWWIGQPLIPVRPCRGFWVRQLLPAFIRNFSQLAAPLTALTSTRVDVQVVECSWSCILQPQEPLRFGSHSRRPWSHTSIRGGGWCVGGGV